MAYEGLLRNEFIIKLIILFVMKEYKKPLTNQLLTQMALENVEITEEQSEKYNECYKVILENSLSYGILNQTVGGTPAANTFSTRDEAGSYKATVYVSAVTEL